MGPMSSHWLKTTHHNYIKLPFSFQNEDEKKAPLYGDAPCTDENRPTFSKAVKANPARI